MPVNVLMAGVFTSLALVVGWVLFPYRRVNPALWFVPFNWLIGAGTIMQLDFTRPDDSLYAWLFFGAMAAFGFGAFAGLGVFNVPTKYRRFWAQELESDPRDAAVKIVGLVAVAIAVTFTFYSYVGYNLLFQVVAGSAPADFTSARLQTYSGRDYFAPGYVNQFKNVLLPLGLTIMAGWAWRAGKLRTVWTVGLVGFPITLLALLGTGQRGPLVLAFAAILFGVMAIRRLRVGAVAVSGAVILVLFGVFSSYLGRIRVFSFNSVALEFTKRLFVEEQSAGLTAFRYVRARDVVWFREWGAGFLGLLPSNRGSDLDSRLFALIHGSTRGNTTPSTIASVYHNGGLVMVPIVFMVLGFAYTFAYSRFLSGPRTIARCLTYGAMFFYLASWVGGAPVSLINKGVVTLIAVLAICKVRVVVSAPSVPRFTPAARGVPVAPRL